MPIALLNSPRLTNYGYFHYAEISLEEARQLLSHSFTSFIGHEQTAIIIETLCNIHVEVNRNHYTQLPGDKAIIFELNSRLADYKEISIEEIRQIGFKWGILEIVTI